MACRFDKDIAMNRTLLALAASLLIAGIDSPVFGQEVSHQYDRPHHANGDADNDSIPNAQDRHDDRYDEAGNPVRYEVGESLPADSYGNMTAVDYNLYGLRPPPAGDQWNRLGDNFYLVQLRTGRIVDAVYNLHD
jgi:Ni/Co efflux regulator RcnB